ncbi:MAG: AI-2E family transporter [Parcubacteria group bacterium]|nr:AI-2E family transporter [Parcubacteria group bacterium]
MDNNHHHTNINISTSVIVKSVLIVLLFFVAFFLKDLLLALLGSIVVATAIEPITRWFINHKIPRLPSVLFIYLMLAFFVAGTFYFLVVPLLSDTSVFLNSLPAYLGSVDSSNSSAQPFLSNLGSSFSLKEIVSHINSVVSGLSEGLWSSISFVFGGFLSFILIIVISFYLSVQEDGIGVFLKTVSPLKHRKYVASLWERSQRKIGLWMQGQLLLAVIIAVLVYLGLALFGIKHALLLAVLAGVFELIPLFGPVLAAVPAVALAFLNEGITTALLIVGFYVIIQQFENQLIYPLVVKKVVGVSPIISIVALVAGVQLAGFMGLLLSVPVAAVLMEFFNDVQRDKVLEEEASSRA